MAVVQLPPIRIPTEEVRLLQERYERPYYHGEGSGYPSDGYGVGHPDWAPWIEFLRRIDAGAPLVDVGCAYGFLVEACRRVELAAFGFDVSAFALRESTASRPYLGQALAEAIPCRTGVAGIVALFDVLEHLHDPLACLAECRRILAPEGVVLGATPDPVFFDRSESTHVFERPPSHWILALRQLGFRVAFRFSVNPYNFQFVAALEESRMTTRLSCFGHDFLEAAEEFVSVAGPLEVVPRWGWGPLADQKRPVAASSALLYVLNLAEAPQAARFSFRAHLAEGFCCLRVRMNNYVLGETQLTPQSPQVEVSLPEFLVPTGGHHLFFDVFPEASSLSLSGIKAVSRSADSRALVEGLPFDLYQRYQLAADITVRLGVQSVLDIGGYLGDQYGHLASPHDFLASPSAGAPGPQIFTTDIRQCDHPSHAPALAWQQPFDTAAFDLVMTLDVLEHLPPQCRIAFLEELDRVSRRFILVGAPFSSSSVEEAEMALSESLLASRAFLQEHRELGLPSTSLVTDFFRSRGYDIRVFPSGYLPRWFQMQILTQHYFGLHDYLVIQAFNRSYNRNAYREDQREPAYRTLFLVAKATLQPGVGEALTRLESEGGEKEPESWEARLGRDPDFTAAHDRIRCIQQLREQELQTLLFLAAAQGKHARLLKQHADNLEVEPDRLRREAAAVSDELQRVRFELQELRSSPLWNIALRRTRDYLSRRFAKK